MNLILFVCFFTIIKKKEKITNPGLDWRCFGPMKFWTETLYSKWEVMYSPTGVLLQYYATICTHVNSQLLRFLNFFS